VVAAAAGLWLALRPAAEPEGAPDEPVAAAPAPAPAAAPPPAPPSPPQPSAAPPFSPVAQAERDHAPDTAHQHHPMDEARQRINAENALIQRLNDAMSFRKVAEMREMIAEYRRLDPADTDASQAGYTVIADCIEHPGDASLAAAHQFYDTQRHSPLRRWVRRICFEGTN
jgi:hypothetical protein